MTQQESPIVDTVQARYRSRVWSADDDPALRRLMLTQMQRDPHWPPDYARGGDLADWLREPASEGRWVAVDDSDTVVGHVGLGRLSPEIRRLLNSRLPATLDAREICRLVVDPSARNRGLASLLTRRAMRAAIEAGALPIATVLANRESWLEMMLETGWSSVGTAPSRAQDVALLILLPPQRFVDLVVSGGDP